ncbi:hypothetical protein [Streptomyces sp. NRRL S-1813]|uniref:hypothetical protein n=1 Tax=Streptomyces sp. NRRL S-1813 TaxID=1463888 RepID=UPI0004CB5C75|nr:hypothetical protein [Streptomyces sp. NRRL S-1813]
MTIADHRPATPASDTVRELLASAAADYAAAEEHRHHAQANATADAEKRARAARSASDQYDCATITHRVTH